MNTSTPYLYKALFTFFLSFLFEMDNLYEFLTFLALIVGGICLDWFIWIRLDIAPGVDKTQITSSGNWTFSFYSLEQTAFWNKYVGTVLAFFVFNFTMLHRIFGSYNKVVSFCFSKVIYTFSGNLIPWHALDKIQCFGGVVGMWALKLFILI